MEEKDTYNDLGYIQDGSIFNVDEMNFSRGAAAFHVMGSSESKGGALEIHLGSPTGPVVGKCDITETGSWSAFQEFTCTVAGCDGRQDLYFVCRGTENYLFNVDKFWFTPMAGDVTGDGGFDTLDVVAMQKYLLGLGTLKNPEAAEFTGDGELDVFDLSLMKRALLK